MKNIFTKRVKIALAVYFALILTAVIITAATAKKAAEPEPVAQPTVVETQKPDNHYIEGVPVIAQTELHSGCETYACTMLLQSMGFDIDEFGFAENYLITSPISYGYDGTRYGPDMHSAFAGDVYEGYGVFATAMAKSMNNYFKAVGSDKTATALSSVTLAGLCDQYIDRDLPVMVWATVDMQEPYEKAYWVVDYTDENATTEKGDTVAWMQNEHCLVLIGYDSEKYYFSDSCAGAVSSFEKALCEERFSQLGNQAIVVQ